MTDSPDNLAQALSRGIEVLRIVTSSPHPRTATWIAEQAGFTKATTYRLLRTLEHHDLVAITEDGRYLGGPGLTTLAARAQRSFRQLVAPTLRELADSTGLTAFVVMQDEDECVTLLSVVPSGFTTSLAQNPGSRHSIISGAPGKAILSIIPRHNWPDLSSALARVPKAPADSGSRSGSTAEGLPVVPTWLEDEIEKVWRDGYAVSHNEVLPGVSSIAVPFQVAGERPCALALLCTGEGNDIRELASQLGESAAVIERRA